MTIDELARKADVPGRTSREYQTMKVLPPPIRVGRVGVYDAGHLQRLRVIARLQERGYSLAGIRDLFDAFDGGGDLLDVLADPAAGLLEEAALRLDDDGLAALLTPLGTRDRKRLTGLGLITAEAPGVWCVPAPSLVRLAADTIDAGLPRDDVYAALRVLVDATATAAEGIVNALTHALAAKAAPTDPGPLLGRGRLLLGPGVARLLIHQLGQHLQAVDDPTLTAIATDTTPIR